MHTVLTVIIKNTESTYRQKFSLYEEYTMDPGDPIIQKCIEQTKENFKGEAEDIQIRSDMVVK